MNIENEIDEIDAERLNNEFKKELLLLCDKYQVTLQADDHWTGYAECGQDIRITASFENWKINEIDFGLWIDGKGYKGQQYE